MGIFQFLIFLGIINIVFGFVWKWVFVLPSALLFAVLKLSKGMLLVKAFGAYLLISLTALTTLAALQDASSIWKLIFFSLVGMFVLLMGFGSIAYEQRKQARMNFDLALMEQLERNAWFDSILIIAAPILYVLILFLPTIALNPVTGWLFGVIGWVYGLSVIGWLIGIGGILFMLSTIFNGFMMLLVFGGVIYGKIKGEAKEKEPSVGPKP